MNLTLSQNVAAASLENLDDITYTFIYPHEPIDPNNPDAPIEPKYIRLWMPGKNAPVQRTENDIIRPRTPISGTDLGLGPGGEVVVYIEGLAPSYGTIAIDVRAEVQGTEVQWTEDVRMPLKDTVHVEVISVGLDTEQERIFINKDDDNKNGVPDVDDDSSDYGLTYEDNDFAEIQINLGINLNHFNGYKVRIESSGLELYSSRKKERDSMPVAPWADPQSGVYEWTIADGQIAMPTTLYAEGVLTGQRWVCCTLLRSDGEYVIDEDEIEINVEKIVWPSNETDAANMGDPDNWANQNSENWNGFEVGEAWEINKSLCEIINGDDSDIRTRYPEKRDAGWCNVWEGTGDYKTTKADLPSGDFTVTVNYAFQEAPDGRTINSFADTTKDYIKPGFHINSGICIGNTEIQIFNSAALASLLDAEDTGGTVVLDGNSSARIYAYDDESTKKVWLTQSVGGPPPSDPDLSESYSGLVNAILYNKSGRTDADFIAYDSNDNEVDLNTFSAVTNARMGGTITIVVRPDDEYKLAITCSDVTYRYKALPPTSTQADANKITLQSHWGSGVVFTNVSITED